MKIDLDKNSVIAYRGMHNDVAYEIKGFNFNDERHSPFDMKAMWSTYIILTEEMHEKVKYRINGAPWNGGQTFYHKITEEHVDAPAEFKEKWSKPYYKIGDDFSHLWDMDRQDLFYRAFFERHIKAVIEYLFPNPKHTKE